MRRFCVYSPGRWSTFSPAHPRVRGTPGRPLMTIPSRGRNEERFLPDARRCSVLHTLRMLSRDERVLPPGTRRFLLGALARVDCSHIAHRRVLPARGENLRDV